MAGLLGRISEQEEILWTPPVLLDWLTERGGLEPLRPFSIRCAEFGPGLARHSALKKRHGPNYHQWLSSQYGLKKLLEHIWMVIGIAKTSASMSELKEKMAHTYGKYSVQYTLYLAAQKA